MKQSINRGFTLIELLGVIVLLALLLLLVFPSVLNLITKSRGQVNNITTELVKDAADAYIDANKNDFKKTNGNSYCITLSDLVSAGYIKTPIVFSDTDIDQTNLKSVQVNYQDGFTYEIKDNDECVVHIPYTEAILNGSDPDLQNGTLTPVVYDETYDNNKGAWVVADLYDEWYKYEEQRWANAVLLSNDVRKQELKVGTPLALGTDILAMFVWIPRYSYTISDTAKGENAGTGSSPKYETPKAIDIKFVGTSTIENGTATYTGDTQSNWYTHPAFSFGSQELSGIWVGKFETHHIDLSSKTSSTTANLNCTNKTCESAKGLRILPNVVSLRYNTVSSFFFASRSMSRDGNPFLIDASITDSHMMKNSEWGAVAYLSQSIYGKYGNSNYVTISDKEVKINSCSSYKTGMGENCTDTYETIAGQAASTTGTVYGVYDMSGGAYEYVMGVLADSEGNPRSGYNSSSNSGFNGSLNNETYSIGVDFPDAKYYDLYTVISNSSCKDENGNTILECRGHALSETAGWYSDTSRFINLTYPWFIRGGHYSNTSTAGVFYSSNSDGTAYLDASFRIVLVARH